MGRYILIVFFPPALNDHQPAHEMDLDTYDLK